MAVVLRILVTPILASLYLLLTPVALLVTIIFKEEDNHNAKEANQKPTESLESIRRMELLRRFTVEPVATVSVHRSTEAQRRRELVSASTEAQDSLLPRKLRENGPRREDKGLEEGLRRIRTKSVRDW